MLGPVTEMDAACTLQLYHYKLWRHFPYSPCFPTDTITYSEDPVHKLRSS